MLPQPSDLSTLAGFTDFVEAHPRAVLVTVDDLGAPRTSPVQVRASNDGDLQVRVDDASRAGHDLAASRRVCLVLGDLDGVSLQVEGLAPRSLADAADPTPVVVRPTWLRWSTPGGVLQGAA